MHQCISLVNHRLVVDPHNISVSWLNNPSPDEMTKISLNQEGGIILGLNSFLNCKFFLYKDLFASTEISFGFLHTETGSNKVIEEDFTNYLGGTNPHSNTTYTITDKLKKSYFSPPELSLGLGYKF